MQYILNKSNSWTIYYVWPGYPADTQTTGLGTDFDNLVSKNNKESVIYILKRENSI